MKFLAHASIAATILSVSACDLLDAPKVMKQMKETTENMESTTGTMFLEIRSKESRDTRLKEITAMEASDTFYNKTLSAAAYFKAFEYQLYTHNPKLENARYFKELRFAAIKEFMRQANHYLDKTPADEMSPTSKDESAQNFMALAVAMHEVHDYQLKMVHEKGVEKLDMFKLIQRGLALRDAYNDYDINLSEDDPRLLVLQNHDTAKALLQARVDMLSAMIVSRVSDINRDYSNVFLGIPDLMNKLKKLYRRWDSNFAGLERAKRDETLAWAREATRSQAIMNRLGEDYEMNKTLRKVFSNMRRTVTTDMGRQSGNESNEFDNLMEKLLN